MTLCWMVKAQAKARVRAQPMAQAMLPLLLLPLRVLTGLAPGRARRSTVKRWAGGLSDGVHRLARPAVRRGLLALPVGQVPRQCHLFWSLKTWAEGPPKYRTPPIGSPRFA